MPADATTSYHVMIGYGVVELVRVITEIARRDAIFSGSSSPVLMLIKLN
jgi:hypothetical protein